MAAPRQDANYEIPKAAARDLRKRLAAGEEPDRGRQLAGLHTYCSSLAPVPDLARWAQVTSTSLHSVAHPLYAHFCQSPAVTDIASSKLSRTICARV